MKELRGLVLARKRFDDVIEPRRIAKRATVLAVILFALFYLNYTQGWVTAQDLDYTGGAPDLYAIPASGAAKG